MNKLSIRVSPQFEGKKSEAWKHSWGSSCGLSISVFDELLRSLLISKNASLSLKMIFLFGFEKFCLPFGKNLLPPTGAGVAWGSSGLPSSVTMPRKGYPGTLAEQGAASSPSDPAEQPHVGAETFIQSPLDVSTSIDTFCIFSCPVDSCWLTWGHKGMHGFPTAILWRISLPAVRNSDF